MFTLSAENRFHLFSKPTDMRKSFDGLSGLVPLSDSQVNLVVKDYYTDEFFCRNDLGNINLWKLYNLFTGANKMSYIDSFLDRNVGCQQFVNGLYQAIGENRHHWFVS